jgi:hypothetical protein
MTAAVFILAGVSRAVESAGDPNRAASRSIILPIDSELDQIQRSEISTR